MTDTFREYFLLQNTIRRLDLLPTADPNVPTVPVNHINRSVQEVEGFYQLEMAQIQKGEILSRQKLSPILISKIIII